MAFPFSRSDDMHGRLVVLPTSKGEPSFDRKQSRQRTEDRQEENKKCTPELFERKEIAAIGRSFSFSFS